MQDKFKSFDPNSPGLKNNNIFGLPFTEEEAELIIIPVPWEVTVSYRQGTSRGPEQILEASFQVDLFDPELNGAWKKGFHMIPVDKNIRNKSDYLRSCAELIIGCLYEGSPIQENNQLCTKLREVNEGGKFLHDWLHDISSRYLKMGKKVAILGGDHSTPLGFLKALSEHYSSFGILQIDAHADLRKAYEGFTYSHASIMHNVLEQIPQVKKLIQMGIRDFCDEEYEIIRKTPGRIKTFFDQDIKEALFNGQNWADIVAKIIKELPENLYISFDIDGLDPKLCPNTGTPVPGGFDLDQVFYLFKKIKESGKNIIGFDLNEVSSGAHGHDCIDPIVGSRALFKLCSYLASA
jgi:agmatinase